MPLPKSNELNFENSIATIRWESGFKSTHQDGEKAVVLSLNSLTVKKNNWFSVYYLYLTAVRCVSDKYLCLVLCAIIIMW